MSRLQLDEQYTKTEVAEALDISEALVTRLARELGVGVNYRGRKGWRFTRAEAEKMRQSREPGHGPEKADPRGRQPGVHA